jgi:AmiR/NasT family two-component response regulator
MSEKSSERVVWIISNHHWPRAYIRAELIERGFDAIGFEETSSALAAFRSRQTAQPDLIVLDLQEQQTHQSEIEKLTSLNIPVIALMSSAEWNQEAFRKYAWTTVIRRPFTIGDACNLVEKRLRGLNH